MSNEARSRLGFQAPDCAGLMDAIESSAEWATFHLAWRPGYWSEQLSAMVYTNRYSSLVVLVMEDGSALCQPSATTDCEFKPLRTGPRTVEGVLTLMARAGKYEV